MAETCGADKVYHFITWPAAQSQLISLFSSLLDYVQHVAYITVTIIADWIRECLAFSGPADVCLARPIRSLYPVPGNTDS